MIKNSTLLEDDSMETDVSEEPATSAFRVKAVKAFDIIYFKCA